MWRRSVPAIWSVSLGLPVPTPNPAYAGDKSSHTRLPDAPPTLVNDLLCGEGGIISTEPARRVMALARQVATSPELAALFAVQPDDGQLWRTLPATEAGASFRAAVQAYLDRFGDRCMNELKLETVTLGEDPTFLLRMVRAYAAQGNTDPEAARTRETTIRQRAEALVRERLRGARRRLYLDRGSLTEPVGDPA